MADNSIKDLITGAMQSIKEMVDVNNVIGEAVTTPDGTVIIPVAKVTCGFGASGFEMAAKMNNVGQPYPFGGGSGGGLSIEPIAFLVVSGGNVRLIPAANSTDVVSKIIDAVPPMVDKLNDYFTKHFKKEKSENAEEK